MFKKILFSAFRAATSSIGPASKLLIQNVGLQNSIIPVASRGFSSVINQYIVSKPLLLKPQSQIITNAVTRTVTKYSFRKGKRKSVKAVLRRFYRLNWGIWIRTKCGRNKRLWRKTSARKRRLRQHVFCNAQQSYLLDKMVGPYWRKPRHYVDDPYEPYHVRDEWSLASSKPRPYFPPEQ